MRPAVIRGMEQRRLLVPFHYQALKPLDSRSPLFYYQAQSSNALAGKPGEGFTS